MKTINLVYCIPSLHTPSGMERVLTLKCNYLAQTGKYNITIILTENRGLTPYYKLHPKIKIINLGINIDDIYRQSLPRRIISYYKKEKTYRKELTNCLMQLKPDLTISLLRREINFINKIPDGSIKLGEIHFSKANYRDFKNNKLPKTIQNIVGKFWMQQLIKELKKLERFIVLSHEDKILWTELNNISVINNPLSFIPDNISNCESKQVIAVGRHHFQKGFDFLIEIWKEVASKHPDWKLKIYGNGDTTEIQKQINNYQLNESCLLEAGVPNIENKYLESSIFVLTSRYEGFPMVLPEAMICGVPPVAFTCPCGPKDIINDGIDGRLVPYGNIKEFANQICYLIENEDARKKMGMNAHCNIQRLNINVIGKQWEELFETVLKKAKHELV